MPLKTLSGKHADPRKGRGAGINPEGRFEKVEREAFDDGWDRQEGPSEGGTGAPSGDVTPETDIAPGLDRSGTKSRSLESRNRNPGSLGQGALPPLKTHVTAERVKSIISRNDSPDIPFTQSINPYQGCEHGCVYCLSGDTPILMADGRTRALAEVGVGDEIYGTVRQGWYRRYTKTRVLAHWSVVKPAYRITLEDGTCLVAGPDHRFLTERGWKFVTGTMGSGDKQRPYLTINNKLMGTGAFAHPCEKSEDYQFGYLCGLIRGDGLLASYHYQRAGRAYDDQHQFRLALCDMEALERARDYLARCGIFTNQFVFQKAVGERGTMHAIRTHARAAVEQVRGLIAWPGTPRPAWVAGFLAGIFDAEGSCSQGVLRISNTDKEIISWIDRCLRIMNFRFVVEHLDHQRKKPIDVIRLVGGLREQQRFFQSVDPAISRKRDFAGQAVKSSARLGVVSVEPLSKAMRLYDITTGTEDFIANGVVSHNCYARPSHAYRNLSPGIDFETRLFAKVNAAEKLREELSRPGYRCEVISLGANTDPYQPVEREWKITRGILEVCAEFNQPVGIVTKNAMVERDLDLLAPMARRNLAAVHISCNNLDHDLARRLEPRCTAPARRLEAMRRLSEAGVPVGVLVAPVIPFLTDHQIEPVLQAAWENGARQAGYILMRLPWEVKELFRDWLERNYPLKAKHVMSRVHAMRGGRDNDPEFGSRMRGTGELAALLAQRFRKACERLGYNAGQRNRSLDTAQFRRTERSGQLSLFDEK